MTAHDGANGARLALETLPDLILLDKEMPGMHGFDVSRILRRHQDTSGIPILMISSETETAEKIRGLEMGADDFITKGITGEELHSKISAFLRIKDLQDKLQAGERQAQPDLPLPPRAGGHLQHRGPGGCWPARSSSA